MLALAELELPISCSADLPEEDPAARPPCSAEYEAMWLYQRRACGYWAKAESASDLKTVRSACEGVCLASEQNRVSQLGALDVKLMVSSKRGEEACSMFR